MTPEQLAEVPWLMKECGVPTLKYYMFYKTLDLSGSSDSGSYLINKTSLDFGFVYRLMKAIALVNREYGSSGPGSLSVPTQVLSLTVLRMRRAASNRMSVMTDKEDRVLAPFFGQLVGQRESSKPEFLICTNSPSG